MKPLFITLLAIAPFVVWPAAALGQDLPPGPSTIHALARMPVAPDAGRFAETQVLLLDFAPGAWTPLHSHGGLTLVRVLEGEMTRRRGGVEDRFTAGEGWVETPGDVHAAGNAGAAPARVQATFLLPAGAPLTTVAGAATEGAPPGPTTAYQSKRVPVTAAPAFDEAATTVVGFAPGAWTPLHSHAGLTLVAVMEGEMTVRAGGRETVYRAGDVWIELPGDVHAAGNTTAAEARLAVTFLQRRGDPVTTVAASQTPLPLPRALPRTGGAGALVVAAAASSFAVLGAGLSLRRRLSRA